MRWLGRDAWTVGAAATLCLLAVGGSIAVVRGFAAGRSASEGEVPSGEVALVLGAQVYANGEPSPFLAARLDVARRLWETGKVRVLLVSGDGRAPSYDEPAAMERYLIAHGVPADRIVRDPAGYDTYDSCVRAKLVYGVNRVTVVSQSYHIPRAVGTCRLVGVSAYGVGDDSVRRLREPWVRGAVRDQIACVKTIVDVISRRQPVLGPADDSVRRALQS